ncbi:hypothetical protein PS15p_210613 [Mucor circinelloides]
MDSRKRKSYTPHYHDDEEEDIWEREASTAASSCRNIKPTPPNPYAKEIDILNNQYEILQTVENDLQQELLDLKAGLQALEQNETDEQDQLKQVEEEYLVAAQEAIAFYESRLKDTQNIEQDETITVNNDTPYLKTDALLIKESKRILQEWKSVLTYEKLEDTNAIIDTAIRHYRKNEFDILDLNAQISGQEARIQVLERDRAKLNSLPQILPIIKSETEKYAANMEETTKKLEQLEKDVIRPYLEKVAEQNVSYPLYASFIANEITLAQDYVKDLECLHNVCMKQRSYQQLTTLLYEKDAALRMRQLRSLKSLVVDQTESQPLNRQALSDADIEENYLVMVIKDLLKKALEKMGINAADLPLAEQIKALQDHAKVQNRRWHEDFQSCQDAANELISLHKRLSDSLYSHSKSTDELIMTPEQYTTLQEEIEFRTMELKAALSMLEKDANNNERKSLFEQQRKLFSLFFTDPLTFEHLHSNIS